MYKRLAHVFSLQQKSLMREPSHGPKPLRLRHLRCKIDALALRFPALHQETQEIALDEGS